MFSVSFVKVCDKLASRGGECELSFGGDGDRGRVSIDMCNGDSATCVIHQRYPWIRILVLSTFDEDEYIWQSLQFGALGYWLKSTPASQLAAAIRVLSQGCSQLGPTIAPKVFAQLNPMNPSQPDASGDVLSEREKEVILLLGEGKNNKEIAQSLHLSQGTVRNHISRILSELGLRDLPKEGLRHRTQAAL